MQHNNTQPDPVPHHDDARAEALHQTKQGRDTDAKTFAIAAARALKDARCDDILVLDVSGKNPVTDYIVIGTGTSDRQMRSAARRCGKCGKGLRLSPVRPRKGHQCGLAARRLPPGDGPCVRGECPGALRP